eukprot:2118624-Amphidinium_carterae.5
MSRSWSSVCPSVSSAELREVDDASVLSTPCAHFSSCATLVRRAFISGGSASIFSACPGVAVLTTEVSTADSSLFGRPLFLAGTSR